METISLFKWGLFTTHSGQKAHWKLECDAFTDEEWETLAKIVAKKFNYAYAIGVVSENGNKFASALNKVSHNDDSSCVLLVDDVLTTGNSMEELLKKETHDHEKFIVNYYRGIVVFARSECPDWITPIFSVNSEFL